MDIKILQPTDALSTLLKVDPKVARLIYRGLAVVAAGVIIGSWIRFGGGSTLKYGIYAVCFGILLSVAVHFTGMISRIIAWFALSLFLVWGVLIFIQIILNNVLHPPVAKATCLMNPVAAQCAMAAYASNAPQIDPRSIVAPDSFETFASSLPNDTGAIVAYRPSLEPGQPSYESPPTPEPIVVAPAIPQLPAIVVAPTIPQLPAPDPRNEVYIHFFEPVTQNMTKAAATRLEENGWNVPGASQGGQEIEVAGDFMEVRFFFEEDAALAAQLALDLDAYAEFSTPVTLRDMAQTRWASNSRPGRLEVYLGK